VETHVRCRIPAGGHASSRARRCSRKITSVPLAVTMFDAATRCRICSGSEARTNATSPRTLQEIINGQFVIYRRPASARAARRGDAEDRAKTGRQHVVFLASAFQRFAFQTQSVAASLCEAWRRSQSDGYKKRLQDSGRILKPIAGFKRVHGTRKIFPVYGSLTADPGAKALTST
jgi:hypothetical protein